MSSENEKRKILDLRVVDLRVELEKRKLDTSGVKLVLSERLSQALREEGHNPDEYLFDINDKKNSGKRMINRGNRNSISSSRKDEGENTDEHEDDLVTKNDMEGNDYEDVDQVGDVEKTISHVTPVDTTHADNEDSLNLTIGEEDEKLLHCDDNDSSAKNIKRNLTQSADDLAKTESGADNVKLSVEENGKKQPAVKNDADKKQSDTKLNENSESKTSKSNGTDEKENTKKTTSSTTSINGTVGKAKTTSTASSSSSSNTQGITTAQSNTTSVVTSTVSISSVPTLNRNLWVSGLSSVTRATDLKQIFSKYGKVIGAKVVTNARTPGARCYGYVTMTSADDATECIEHLHRTELHGRMISVERAKSDLSGPPKPIPTKITTSIINKKKSQNEAHMLNISHKKDSGNDGAELKRSSIKDKHFKDTKKSALNDKTSGDDFRHKDLNYPGDSKRKEPQRFEPKTISKSRGRSRNNFSPGFGISGRSGGGNGGNGSIGAGGGNAASRRARETDVLSYQKIRDARERQRLREKERELREEDRRRRDIRRRQREEELRLKREREKLQLERERIEKEKAELMRLERERQKLDWEKIEQDRQELKRQQRKIEEAKRSLKRPVTEHREYEETDRKRPIIERRFEAPPPPRFETSIISRPTQYDRVGTVEKKRGIEDYNSSKRDDYKREPYKRNEEYKRDIDLPAVRHSGSGVNSSGGVITSVIYDSRVNSVTHRGVDAVQTSNKERYSDRPSSDFRSSRGSNTNVGNSTISDERESRNKPRYLESPSDNRYQISRTTTSAGTWHNASLPQVKVFGNMSTGSNNDTWGNKLGDGGWRPMESNQDRFDRTYNERKAQTQSTGQFIEPPPPRPNSFMGRPQERYNNSISSRFDNSRF